MANPQHIDWFSEGAESWNARRRKTSFTPDLEGANLSAKILKPSNPASDSQRPSLEGINLRSSVLRKADLSDLQLPKASLDFTQARESVFQRTNLKGAELRAGNFAGATFQDANLRGALLTAINLAGANLQNAHLQDAHCVGAELTGANLGEAHLASADLFGAHLKNANLIRADLTEANLSEVDLSKAILVQTNVANADLKRATLAGVVAPDTQLWRAALYEPRNTDIEAPEDLSISISSVTQLLKVCHTLREHCTTVSKERDHEQDYILYFRGHALSDWNLSSSVTRCPSQGELDVRGKEGAMLMDLMTRQPEEFSRITSSLSQWVLAQQYRLRTRLLDITRNPLVALFFACDDADRWNGGGALHLFVVPTELVKPFNSDSISVVANLAKLSLNEQDTLLGKSLNSEWTNREKVYRYSNALDRLYQHIATEKPYFKERIDPRDLYRIFVVEPEQSFERLRAQSGAFLISAFHQCFEPEKIRGVNPDVPLYEHYSFTVPADCKEAILRELSLLNVTRETLFPGLDEATQAVMRDHAT